MGFLDKALQKAKTSGFVEDAGEAERRQQDMQEHVEGMWHWLRTTLDEACDRYQHEGNDDLLRQCLTGQALEEIRAHLDEWRRRNMVLCYPRERRNEFQLQINDVLDDTYVLTEYFRDHSFVQRYQGQQLVETIQGDGQEKAVRATVVARGEEYHIERLSIISDPAA